MADAYLTKRDVSIPRPVAKLSGEGDNEVWATEGVNYPAGSHVLASNMEPRVRKAAEAGDLDHLLEPSSLEDAANAPAGEPEFGLFVAEHEAEAHALRQYGHQVVPREQELEVLASGGEHARAYQEAVAEHGLDERPQQAAMQQPPERVPDEALAGHETRTGLPTLREPQLQSSGGGEAEAESEENGEENGEEAENSESGEAPRARPGA